MRLENGWKNSGEFALRCVALRYVTFGTLEVSQEKEKFSRFHNQKTLLFVLSYTFFRAMQPIFMVKISTFLCFTYLLIISALYSYFYKLGNRSDQNRKCYAIDI